MKQDIRDLFKQDDVSKRKLPKKHRNEFFKKLQFEKQKEAKPFNYKWIFKVAAFFLVFLAVSYFLFSRTDNTSSTKTEEFIVQIKSIEKDYLESINKEWENFLLIAKDENLVNRYKEKLKDLDTDYKEISEAYNDHTNDVFVIEALVENLQTRLNLIKDIQKHINQLNQQSEHIYETTL